MPISKENKEAIVDALIQAKRKAQRLALTLRFQGRAEDAKKVEKKIRTLAARIDDLITQSMESWVGNAQGLLDRMRKTNTALQASLRDIKKKKDVANKVVKALGRLDDVIDVAKGVLKKV